MATPAISQIGAGYKLAGLLLNAAGVPKEKQGNVISVSCHCPLDGPVTFDIKTIADCDDVEAAIKAGG